jgi:hypothetical protein
MKKTMLCFILLCTISGCVNPELPSPVSLRVPEKKSYVRLTKAVPGVGFDWKPATFRMILEDSTQQYYYPHLGAVTKSFLGISENISAGLVVSKGYPRTIHIYSFPAGTDLADVDQFKWGLMGKGVRPLIYLNDVSGSFAAALTPATEEDWNRGE